MIFKITAEIANLLGKWLTRIFKTPRKNRKI